MAFITLSNPQGVPGGDAVDMIVQKKEDSRFVNSRTAQMFADRGQDPVIANQQNIPLRAADDPDNYVVQESELFADNDLSTADPENLSFGQVFNTASRVIYDYNNGTGNYAPGQPGSDKTFTEVGDLSGMENVGQTIDPLNGQSIQLVSPNLRLPSKRSRLVI